MDICFQIIINPTTHDLSYDTIKDAARQKAGDVIDVLLATDVGTWDGSDFIPNDVVGSPRCGFVFVVGVPNRAIKAIKEKFFIDYRDPIVVENPDILLRRRFGIRVSSIPLAVRQQMVADKYITFTWAQVKNFLRDKVFDRNITDSDLP